MAVSDIFSSSFLFSIATIIILIGGIFAYISYRMAEQDKKLNAMIGLITTMAEESQFFRGKLNALQQKMNNNDIVKDETNKLVPISSQEVEEILIDVSDGEEDTDEDEYDEDEEEYDEDEEEEDEKKEDLDEEEQDLDENKKEDEDENEKNTSDAIKLLNLTLANDNYKYEDEAIHDVLNIENVVETDNNITKTIHLPENILLDFVNVESVGDLSDLKNIAINADLEEKEPDKADYKKMTLNKLRELVVSKGLLLDASKLKKNDLVNLLENYHNF